MTTIFVHVAKILIGEYLEASNAASTASDQSLIRGFFRNTNVSSLQRDDTNALLKSLKKYRGHQTDEESLAYFKQILQDLYTKVKYEHTKAKLDPGKLNDLLDKMSVALERSFNKIKELDLSFVNMPYDNNPFHRLCARATEYLAQDIFATCIDDEGILKLASKTVNTLFGTAPVTVREQKEACLLEYLQACYKSICATKEGAEYDDIRLEFVKQAVEAIQRKNLKICTDAQLLPSIPIEIILGIKAVIPGPKFRPSRGRLEEYMVALLAELNELKSIALATATQSNTTIHRSIIATSSERPLALPPGHDDEDTDDDTSDKEREGVLHDEEERKSLSL